MKKIILTLTAAALALTAAGCGKTTEKSEKLQVYTSFYAMYDFAKEIGGDKADIYSMCPVGTEPHDYEPKTSDMAKLTDSDIFIYNGGSMESWAEKTASTLSNVTVVCASDNADKKEGTDPHLWLDPKNAVKEAEAIKNAFVESDNTNKDYYEANYKSFEEKAKKLDNEFKENLAALPKKDIVVSHAAYGYICSAYGLNQIEIENEQGTGDPSPARMAEIVNTVKEKGIKYICAEELETSKVVDAIAKETGAEIVMLNPFEGDKDKKSYFEVMENNLKVLEEILK